jgi:hypothetical protein
MFLAGLFQAVSGFLMWLVIPEGGYRGGRGLDIAEKTFIWDRHVWIDLHDWTAVALVVLVILHLILHWKWIWYMTKKALNVRTQ